MKVKEFGNKRDKQGEKERKIVALHSVPHGKKRKIVTAYKTGNYNNTINRQNEYNISERKFLRIVVKSFYFAVVTAIAWAKKKFH